MSFGLPEACFGVPVDGGYLFLSSGRVISLGDRVHPTKLRLRAVRMTAFLSEICNRLSTITAGNGGDMAHEWLSTKSPLSPWETWTLLCLVRHHARQEFVGQIVRDRLDAEAQAMAAVGALGHPDRPQQGVVPGMLDWEYFFHGRGCCVTHRVRGDAIDVDFYDSTTDWVDPWFFVRFLKSLKDPDFVEGRVVALHPTISTVNLTIKQLLGAGYLKNRNESSVFRLAFDHTDMLQHLNALESSWTDASVRMQMAAAVGDWFLVKGLADDQATRIEAESNIASNRQARASYLAREFSRDSDQHEALHGLDDLESPMLAKLLNDALTGSPSGSMSVALQIITKNGSTEWTRQLQSIIARVNPNDPIPAPHVWLETARLLIGLGQANRVQKAITRIESNTLGEAAILALEYFPDIAIDLFRRALRSKIPMCRIEASAALAVIDRPWSRSELLKVLDESTDHLMTSECRSALMQTHSEACHKRVMRWEAENPREPETGRFLSMTEFALRNSDTWIQWEIQKLHDRVVRLRDIEPTTPQKRRWRWWPRG